ncbi:hypothetical protein Tco_1386357 [Tanacetum coccineum]
MYRAISATTAPPIAHTCLVARSYWTTYTASTLLYPPLLDVHPSSHSRHSKSWLYTLQLHGCHKSSREYLPPHSTLGDLTVALLCCTTETVVRRASDPR